MQPSPNCYALTKASEGLRLRAYQDTGGVWTIGVGHTGGVRPNQTITNEMAEALLEHDMEYAAGVVNSHALPCTQNQFDALTDFCFNVGPSQFLHSTLLKFHLAGQYDKAAAEFPKWKYDNGKVIQGLVTRRLAERVLYSRQEPVEVRPQTDEPEHSVAPTDGSASANPGPSVVQPSPVQPVAPPATVPVSNSKPSVFEERFQALLRKLQAIATSLHIQV